MIVIYWFVVALVGLKAFELLRQILWLVANGDAAEVAISVAIAGEDGDPTRDKRERAKAAFMKHAGRVYDPAMTYTARLALGNAFAEQLLQRLLSVPALTLYIMLLLAPSHPAASTSALISALVLVVVFTAHVLATRLYLGPLDALVRRPFGGANPLAALAGPWTATRLVRRLTITWIMLLGLVGVLYGVAQHSALVLAGDDKTVRVDSIMDGLRIIWSGIIATASLDLGEKDATHCIVVGVRTLHLLNAAAVVVLLLTIVSLTQEGRIPYD